MGRRGVALNTSIIKIANMSSYYNSNQIQIYNSINIIGNASVTGNVSIMGSDETKKNQNVTYNTETYQFDTISNNIIEVSSNELKDLNLYIGNTYIFDQTNNTLPNELIIISKKKLQYNRTSGIIERSPYNTGVSYSEDNTTYNNFDSVGRKYLKFLPTERGIYYIVSKNINTQIKVITINVLDNVYNYSAFSTNSGASISKNLNIAGNMNLKDGVLYVVNDNQFIQPKCVGVNTVTPNYGLDLTGLPAYTDAILLPNTIGAGTALGTGGMIRYNSEKEVVEGFIDYAWESLSGVKDRDKDTYITAIIENRDDQIDFYTNGFNRLTMSNDDFTKIGVGTINPRATLEVNGNMNIHPIGVQSGVRFGNDETDNDRYLDIQLNNNIQNTSFEIIANGNIDRDITQNKINSMNDKTIHLQNFTENLTGTNTFTIDNFDITKINSDHTITTTGIYNRTYEGDTIEIYKNTNTNIISTDSSENYKSNFNRTIDGNMIENIYKERKLFVNGDSEEIYQCNNNITVSYNLNEIIKGNFISTLGNNNNEVYKSNNILIIGGNNTQTIKNNANIFINSTHNVDIKGNSSETYSVNFNKSITSYHLLEVNGSNTKLSNNNTIFYKNNLNLSTINNFSQNISGNKTHNIIGNNNETIKLNRSSHIDSNNTTNIYGNHNYDLTLSFNCKINGNKNIHILNNLTSTINNDLDIIANTNTRNYDKNFTSNVDKNSNKILYNEYNKNITGNVVEIFNKSRKIQSILSGHPLSESNSLSYQIENIDLVLTNYIKIVDESIYNSTINSFPYFYVFPGDGSDNLGVPLSINDWFVFKPGSMSNSWIITNSYYADTNNSGFNVNDINIEYVVLGPNGSDNYAIVLKDTYNSNTTYPYTYKLVIGPRKHQLEYNLTTHFIKIYMIGSNNISIIKLTSTSSTIEAYQIHPYISHVGTSDYRFNNTDSDPTSYPNTNEMNRFIFIYKANSQEKTGDIITKSTYYIYNQEEDKYLKNKGDTTIDIVQSASNALDASFEWTIETVNKLDATANSDVYYIYNNNEYLQIDANDSTYTLTTKDANNVRQHFTLYYFNSHQVNINSSTLVYNNESRIDYLTKNYKKIYINGDVTKYLSQEYDTTLTGNNIIGSGVVSPFLLIYNNTETMPGSGTIVGTFKIYSPNTEDYLFNNSNSSWIIESIDETGGSHITAKHVIKKYDNGIPTKWLYNNNGVLTETDITASVPNQAKFTFEDTSIGINPGTYTSNVANTSSKHIFNTLDMSIYGNSIATYKANLNINTTGNYVNTVKGKYNINIGDNFSCQINVNNDIYISNNISKIIEKKNSITIHKNTTETYKANYTRFTMGNVNYQVRDL